jgi:hypothetical protein
VVFSTQIKQKVRKPAPCRSCSLTCRCGNSLCSAVGRCSVGLYYDGPSAHTMHLYYCARRLNGQFIVLFGSPIWTCVCGGKLVVSTSTRTPSLARCACTVTSNCMRAAQASGCVVCFSPLLSRSVCSNHMVTVLKGRGLRVARQSRRDDKRCLQCLKSIVRCITSCIIRRDDPRLSWEASLARERLPTTWQRHPVQKSSHYCRGVRLHQ